MPDGAWEDLQRHEPRVTSKRHRSSVRSSGDPSLRKSGDSQSSWQQTPHSSIGSLPGDSHFDSEDLEVFERSPWQRRPGASRSHDPLPHDRSHDQSPWRRHTASSFSSYEMSKSPWQPRESPRNSQNTTESPHISQSSLSSSRPQSPWDRDVSQGPIQGLKRDKSLSVSQERRLGQHGSQDKSLEKLHKKPRLKSRSKSCETSRERSADVLPRIPQEAREASMLSSTPYELCTNYDGSPRGKYLSSLFSHRNQY